MYKKYELFDYIVGLLVFFAVVVTLYPFINVISVSLSSNKAVLMHPFMFFPQDININAYKHVFRNPLVYSSYLNTIIITITSTAIGIFATTIAAYPISKRGFVGRKFFLRFFMITMFIGGSGQMIPSFILIRQLKMYNTLWALIIPGCIAAFYIILMMNFFRSDAINSMIESSKIDGASEVQVLVRILLPISKASLATIALFYMVMQWNSFFNAVLYVKDREKWTLQLFLRDLITAANVADNMSADIEGMVPMANIRTAALVITVIPILTVYPFLQKYFVKGVMIGAIKG